MTSGVGQKLADVIICGGIGLVVGENTSEVAGLPVELPRLNKPESAADSGGEGRHGYVLDGGGGINHMGEFDGD